MSTENKDLRFRVLAQVVGGDAVSRFGADVDKLGQSSQRAQKWADVLGSGLKKLAGLYIAKEAVVYAKSIVDIADQMDELSEKTGIAVEVLSAFRTAAEIEGVALDGLAKGLNKLAQNIVSAVSGNKELKDTFDAIGISVKDSSGKIRGSDAVLKDISDKFATMENGAIKTSLAVKLLGKAGAEFIPFLNKGSEEISKFNLAIGSDFAKRAAAFNDGITIMGNGLKNAAIPALEGIIPTLSEISNSLLRLNDVGASDSLKATFQVLGEGARIGAIGVMGLYTGLEQFIDLVASGTREALNTFVGFLTGLSDKVITVGKQLAAIATLDFDKAERIQESYEIRATLRSKEYADRRAQLLDGVIERSEKRANRFADFTSSLAKNSLLLGEGSMDEILTRQQEATKGAERPRGATEVELKDKSKPERDRVQEFIEQQRLENEQRRLALGDIRLTALELIKTTEARKLDAEAIRYSKTMTEEQRAALMLATDEIQKQRAEIIQQEYDMKRTYSYGAREYMREYLDTVTNNANSVKQIFQTTFSSLEDTMVNFVRTGKLNFRNFADAVISELIRIAVRQAVIAPIAGALSGAFAAGAGGAGASSAGQMGSSTMSSAASSSAYTFADGGIMTNRGSIPLNKYANGGIANSPQVALFGEGRRPEAYVPLPDGRSIPVTVKGGGGGANVVVNVNVSKSGADSSVQSDKQMGKDLGLLIDNKIKALMVEQMRPGGLLAR